MVNFKKQLFSFKIDKPQDIGVAFGKLKEELKTLNGKLDGDEQRGLITVLGTEGEYEVHEDYILITITKKLSPLLPNKVIEKEIREKLKEVQKC
ncbi:MAG: hypothetical protein FWB91_01645 [Defluviitaleaceae bacterium]|nr:hypothetical protein [Defluviitaleaceae bacterium]